MDKNLHKRKCSAVCKDGQPCQAWAVIGSDPALCAIHAGRNVGRGAKKGNRNAMKHGLYMEVLNAKDVEDLEMMKSTSLIQELVLTRAALLRLARHLKKKKLSLSDMLAIVPALSTMVRTIIQLTNNIDGEGFDWDEVLDDLNKDWGINI